MAQHLKHLLPKKKDQSPPNPHKCWIDMVARLYLHPQKTETKDSGCMLASQVGNINEL